MMENPFIFTMDSGPFLDIIPILLSHLDLLSLVRLAQTCRFWKQRIYDDLKLWSNIIELPFMGHMRVYACKRHDIEKIIQVKLWSMILPPEDPKALETILEKMASSKESIRRFQHVEKVLFKNFIHTDESLRFTSLLFPSIKEISFEGNLLTMIGIQHIARNWKKPKYIEFYECLSVDASIACCLCNTEDHKQSLERIFIHGSCWSACKTQFSLHGSMPFMALCQCCGLNFNELKNEKEMLCLYHPGTYSGYGHSCSSFNCCGSSTP
ncbi:unnamed protein product [Rotaria magnacalcarata]|uniref:F-box domain-containing protein n=1 Tax=Rotaria magnacalcarata TaxID=392030 RepID=A0A816Z821_9BILA|nr:unnamed protein product [Rotaria magnacalcarata]CAF1625882.1 unnamed protein product [Rotaria magnacalcarata]CAF2190634.1 unnamed protein product [Rotaria magnacalcarata]CAF3805474.1 unnamed protein product [Rotaria magnacalcarata]CAF4132292.1 unnamed protein product [Rotaria magnacalcarata]